MFFLIHNLLWLRTAFLTLCCLALIFTGVGCNQDSAQWKVAAANNAEKDGNPEAAIELLQTALRIDPNSFSIKLRLAKLLAENDQGDIGLTLCDEVLESDPSFKQAWGYRSNCLLSLGRFDEALADYQKFVAESIDKDAGELNQLAYYRGLAGCELDKALGQINRGISKFEQKQPWGNFSNVPIEVSSIVSASLISRHTEDGHLLVTDLLNEAIFEEQQVWLEMNARFKKVVARHDRENDKNPGGKPDELQAEQQKSEAKEASDQLHGVTGNLTVLLATRSLIFEDQNKLELADLDRLWLKRIGYEPQEVYNALPSDDESWEAMNKGDAYLDTRGFVLTQMPWQPTWTTPNGKVIPMETKKPLATCGSYRGALRDLDIAVAASEISLLALDSELFNRIEVPIEDVYALKETGTRMVAVLRHHRRQAHLKANQLQAAEQDLIRIKELGFEVGPNLF